LVKSKLLAILAFISAFISALFYGLLQRKKKERVEDELADEKAATELSNNATEALIRGLNDENKPITRNGRTIS